MMDSGDDDREEVKRLEDARALLADLPARAAIDPSVVFDDDVLSACWRLRNGSLPEFFKLEQALSAITGFLKGNFREAVKARGKVEVSPTAKLGGGIPSQGTAPGQSTRPSTGSANVNEKAATSFEVDWSSLLSFTSGKVDPSEPNVITALTHAPEWRGVLAFNEFANNVVTLKPAPWFRDDAPQGGSRPGPWQDEDDVRLVCWLHRMLGLKVSVPVAMNALIIMARRTVIHPVREYLEALAWDGVERLHSWLATYALATKQPPDYLARVGTWFLISAVARIYVPGCKADHCIILEGEQGRGKSTLVQRLVPNVEWFAEHNANLVDKDAYVILQGRWLLELAELDSLAKAEVGRIKRYMTQAVDAYRPVWARRAAKFPRHCVFIGTVNDHEYLRDPTGNRRFWPVAVNEIDVDKLAEDRDQLWAEAVHYYKAGIPWWPHRDDQDLLLEEQEQRYMADVWEDTIAKMLEKRVKEEMEKPVGLRERITISVPQILRTLGIEDGDQEDKHAIRVGRIMARLQWHKTQVRGVDDAEDAREENGKRRRRWVYEAPP